MGFEADRRHPPARLRRGRRRGLMVPLFFLGGLSLGIPLSFGGAPPSNPSSERDSGSGLEQLPKPASTSSGENLRLLGSLPAAPSKPERRERERAGAKEGGGKANPFSGEKAEGMLHSRTCWPNGPSPRPSLPRRMLPLGRRRATEPKARARRVERPSVVGSATR